MSELEELYREVIIDHTRRPRNFGALPGATHQADGHNRLCGDKLTVYLNVENDTITDIHFEGTGCSISTASASLMTEALKGKKISEIQPLFNHFHDVVTSPPDQEPDAQDLGKLAALAGVRKFPVRVKCATLAWHTLLAALQNKADAPISTE